MPETAALVAAAADGDRTAWEQLVDRHGGLVWAVARSFRLSDADAADVVQTAWLRLVENLGRLREPDRVGSWLATTARHESLAVLRRSARTVPTDVEVLVGSTDPDEPAVGSALESQQDAEALWAAFEGLGERCARLLRVLMADPPPRYAEVSAALDMPVGSIGPTRARCLRQLRDLMGSGGISGPGADSRAGGPPRPGAGTTGSGGARA